MKTGAKSASPADLIDYSNLVWPCTPSSYTALDEKRSKIGQGAFSAVYVTHCLSNVKYNISSALTINSVARAAGGDAPAEGEICVHHHPIAVKVMDLENILSSFDDVVQEVRTMKLCVHENILRCYCSFVHEDKLWLMMQYMDKGSCVRVLDIAKRQLRLGEGFNEEWCAYILRETLKGLAYLHENGHLHRDLKPGNILLSSKGEVRLADFGVTGWLMANGTRQESVKTFVGTPCYMAPEVLEQVYGYDQKADVWSLGITALELAKGYAPYSGYSPMKILIMTLENDPPSLASYPNSNQRNGAPFSKHFEDFYRKCLQKNPKSRNSSEELLKHKFLQHRSEEALVNQLLSSIPSVFGAEGQNHLPNEEFNDSSHEHHTAWKWGSDDYGAVDQSSGNMGATDTGGGRSYVAGTTWVFDLDDSTIASTTSSSSSSSPSASSSKSRSSVINGSSGRVSLLKGNSSSGAAVVRIQYKGGQETIQNSNEDSRQVPHIQSKQKYSTNNIENILDEFESEAASIKTKAQPEATVDHGLTTREAFSANGISSSSSSSSKSGETADSAYNNRPTNAVGGGFRRTENARGSVDNTQFKMDDLMDELEEIIKS